MSSFNGIGTIYYGASNKKPDGSYVATEWFIIFFLPIIPLDSYRLWEGKTDRFFLGFYNSSKTQYQKQKVNLDRAHVFKTYFYLYLAIPFILFQIFTGASDPKILLFTIPISLVGLIIFIKIIKIKYFAEKEIVICRKCGQRLRVPVNKNLYEDVKCSTCKQIIY
ncbi:MAG: hypothetical protein WCS89_02100 [Candidatus Paceibacterota bacterium]